MASPVVPSSTKNFMRLNTEKSRSVDRRPMLAKAQSIAASAAAVLSGTSDQNSLHYVSNGTDVSNGMFFCAENCFLFENPFFYIPLVLLSSVKDGKYFSPLFLVSHLFC